HLPEVFSTVRPCHVQIPFRETIPNRRPSAQQNVDSLDGMDAPEKQQLPTVPFRSSFWTWNVYPDWQNADRLTESGSPDVLIFPIRRRMETRCVSNRRF